MKKIIIFLMLLGFMGMTQIQAQTISFTGSHYGNNLDTLVNSETMYFTSPVLSSYSYGKYDIQIDATNKTGTSTITAILQSSLDGLTWSNHFKSPGQTGMHCDTLAISGTTQHIWNSYPGAVTTYANLPFQTNAGRVMYLRLKLIGGATQTTQIKVKAVTWQ